MVIIHNILCALYLAYMSYVCIIIIAEVVNMPRKRGNEKQTARKFQDLSQAAGFFFWWLRFLRLVIRVHNFSMEYVL